MVTFTFENPEYLWLLIAIPLLAISHFYQLRYTRKKALRFANFMVLKRATGNTFITKNYTILILRLCVLIFAIGAVSGSVIWYESETNENEYVIAIDTSASMSARDVQPTRIDAAKVYALEFIDGLDRATQVGLVSFSGVTFIEQPLTLDKSELRKSLEEIEIEASGTDIPGAIITSTNLLVQTNRGRAIILITDGSNTIETFQSKSLQRAVQYAEINRVRVYTMGVGGSEGQLGYLPTYYNVSSTYNAENLIFIANATGGTYFGVSDANELARAYAEVASLQQRSTVQKNLAPGLMALALLILLVEWGLLNTRFRLLP